MNREQLGQILNRMLGVVLIFAGLLTIFTLLLIGVFQADVFTVMPLALLGVIGIAAIYNILRVQSAGTDESDETRSNQPMFYLLGFALIVIVLILPLLLPISTETLLPPQILLILLLIGGVVVFIVLLGALTDLFGRFQLQNREEALGLPAGSVRALVALLLLLITAIFIFYLFGAARGQTEILEGVTRSDLATMLDTFGTQVVGLALQSSATEDAEPLYNIKIRYELPEAAQDLGGQILTTLATLTSAVAAFYFGSRSVATARSVTTPIEPVIKSLEGTTNPKVGTQGVEFTINGENLAPKRVTLQLNSTTFLNPRLKSAETAKIVCVVDIPNDPKYVGMYKVIVKNTDDTEVSFPQGFEVLA